MDVTLKLCTYPEMRANWVSIVFIELKRLIRLKKAYWSNLTYKGLLGSNSKGSLSLIGFIGLKQGKSGPLRSRAPKSLIKLIGLKGV